MDWKIIQKIADCSYYCLAIHDQPPRPDAELLKFRQPIERLEELFVLDHGVRFHVDSPYGVAALKILQTMTQDKYMNTHTYLRIDIIIIYIYINTKIDIHCVHMYMHTIGNAKTINSDHLKWLLPILLVSLTLYTNILNEQS